MIVFITKILYNQLGVIVSIIPSNINIYKYTRKRIFVSTEQIQHVKSPSKNWLRTWIVNIRTENLYCLSSNFSKTNHPTAINDVPVHILKTYFSSCSFNHGSVIAKQNTKREKKKRYYEWLVGLWYLSPFYISDILWQSVLLVEETGVHG